MKSNISRSHVILRVKKCLEFDGILKCGPRISRYIGRNRVKQHKNVIFKFLPFNYESIQVRFDKYSKRINTRMTKLKWSTGRSKTDNCTLTDKYGVKQYFSSLGGGWVESLLGAKLAFMPLISTPPHWTTPTYLSIWITIPSKNSKKNIYIKKNRNSYLGERVKPFN